jgi:hypothetical protein
VVKAAPNLVCQNFSGLSSAYIKYHSSPSTMIPLIMYSRFIRSPFALSNRVRPSADQTLSQNRTYQKAKAKKTKTTAIKMISNIGKPTSPEWKPKSRRLVSHNAIKDKAITRRIRK